MFDFSQLIYDGSSSFRFISLEPHKIPPEDKDRLKSAGIEIQSIL